MENILPIFVSFVFFIPIAILAWIITKYCPGNILNSVIPMLKFTTIFFPSFALVAGLIQYFLFRFGFLKGEVEISIVFAIALFAGYSQGLFLYYANRKIKRAK